MSSCENARVRSVRGAKARLYLRLRGVVWVVRIVVLTWQGGLDTGGVEEAAQLLLLAHSQAVNDAHWLLLLLKTHTHTSSLCESGVCGKAKHKTL